MGDTPLYSKEKLPADYEAPGGNAWAQFRKTATTRALKVEGPFRVETSESENEPFYCESGYLAVDSRGYPYAIADEEFEQIYAPVEAEVETIGLLEALFTRLRNVSDRERGELLELSAPAAGVSGRLVADASGKLAGFPDDARTAALVLAAIGILDEAQEVLSGE